MDVFLSENIQDNKKNKKIYTVFDGVIAPPRHCTPPIFRILKHFILTCHCTPHFKTIRKLLNYRNSHCHDPPALVSPSEF